MERRRCRARRSAGFTLAEVIVTLGIIAVLLALAVPGVAAARKSLKMAELNAAAREIFLAAQNNLTGMAAGGGAVRTLAFKGGETEVCLMSGDAGMDSVLPLGAVDSTVAGNHYVVVYFPHTLTVKEVYYSERALAGNGTDIQAAYGGDGDARWKDEVGFYNGENIASNPPKTLPKPVLTVENGEELVVKAGVPELKPELIGNVTLTVTVASVRNPADQCELRRFLPNNAARTAEITLDSLAGKRFREVCAEITPGDNIKITAELTYTGSDHNMWLSSKKSKTTNSLFASRDAADTVGIAYGRHLQNLDVATSGADISEHFAAVQTADIIWNRAYRFAPIGNRSLSSYDGNGRFISDLQIDLRDSVTSMTGAGLFSSFENGNGETGALRNIRLVDPKINAGSLVTNVGALAGSISHAVVENCQVYATGADRAYVKGTGDTGGLFGAAIGCDISYSSSGLPLVSTGWWGKSLGGLIGSAKDTALASCYAAADQLSGTAEQIGGFIGHGQNVTVTNSYSVGNISADRTGTTDVYFINGFMTGSGAVSSSYCAMTYLMPAGESREVAINYGFMYKPGSNCAYMDPGGSVDVKNDAAAEKDVKVSYQDLVKWRGGRAWTTLGELDSHPYRALEEGEPKAYPFPGLLTAAGSPLPHYGSWPKEPVASATGGGLTYYERYGDGSWGFYTVDLETGAASDSLRGNDRTIIETGYGVLLPAGSNPDDLGKVALLDIYIQYDGRVFQPRVESYPDAQYHLYPFDPAFLSPMHTVIYDWTRSGARIDIETAGRFTMNPYFGAAILKTDNYKELGKENIPLQVRTVEQFSHLDRYNPGGDYYFKQTHDIDFQGRGEVSTLPLNPITYDGAGNRLINRGSPVFHINNAALIQNVTVERATIVGAKDMGILMESNNGGTIRNCTVLDSTISGTNVAGLVWHNTGQIEDSSFRASSDYADARVESANGNAAGFVGDNRGGTTRRCTVLDSTISGANVAGFVWNNTGWIEDSSFRASSNYADARVESTYGVAAGFVGDNEKSIERCFAVGTVNGNQASGFGMSNGYVGNSYSNCVVTGTSGAAGFYYRGGGMAENCYSLLSVHATSGNAAGFSLSEGWPKLTNCYFAGSVSADHGVTYGFSTDKTEGSDQYYYIPGSQKTAGMGTRLDYKALVGLSLPGESWTGGTPGTSHPYAQKLQGQAYPFPRLNTLDHWGDWPADPQKLEAVEDILGAFYYTSKLLENGEYEVTVYLAALKRTFDGAEYYELEPNPFTVILPEQPKDGSGMGVFCSKNFELEENGNNKGYYYDIDEINDELGETKLSEETKDTDLGFDPNYCFMPVEPEPDEEIELDLSYTHDQGNSGKSWQFDFEFHEDTLEWVVEEENYYIGQWEGGHE